MCFYQYNDGVHEPKILPCSGAHELCLACLNQLRTNGASFLCPVCRETIPPEARINTNRGLLAALEMMRVNVAETAATSSEPVPTEPAATELTRAEPAHAINSSSTGVQCSACKQRFARSAFSRAQLGKNANTRRCKACTNRSVDITDEIPSAPPALAEAAPPTVTEAAPPTLIETSPPTRVEASPPTGAEAAALAARPQAGMMEQPVRPTPAPAVLPTPTAPASSGNFALTYSHPSLEGAVSNRHVFNSPTTPLPFQGLEGGGGPPLRWAELELSVLSSQEAWDSVLKHDRMDLQPDAGQLFDRTGTALGGRGLPEGLLDAHVAALGAMSAVSARHALALYPACCPQAHLVLARTEATSVEAAIAHLERAVDDATALLRLLCGNTPYAAAVAYRLSVRQNRASFWAYVLARPWFRAHLRLGNALRSIGRYEAALAHYMALVEVDGMCWCPHHTYVNYRYFVPSTLLLLGRPLAAKKFILETCAPVHQECFTMASTQLPFQMDLALAEYMVCKAEGRDPTGCFTGPCAVDPATIVQSLPQAPHLAINLVVQFGGATAALLLDRDDGPYALPDLATLPASVGASTSYSQALTYLSTGVIEMWRSVDGALDFFRRYRRHHWALQWLRGSFTPGVQRPRDPFIIPPGLDGSVCAFEKLISRGVLRQADACRLLVCEAVICNECCDVGPGRANYPAFQMRILRSVLALPGLHLVDLGPRSEEPTTLGKVMYYDTFPLGFTYLLASAGFTLWWKDSESSLQVCPLVMAANQGNWRQLALGLDVLSSTQDETVSWPEVMDALSDAIVTSSCLACTIDPNAKRCKRCRRECAHSDGCNFEKCIDVLVYYGLRLWKAYEGDGASVENRRALSWRINERYRCRIAETRGANAPSVMIRRAFASPGGLSRYIAEELSSGTMTQSVHDFMASAVSSGVHTQSELLSSEWRQKIFAAFDREVTVPFVCGQCDSDRHGNPPLLDAMRSATKQTSVCQRCRSSWYCSIQCQKAHWPAHKHVCNKPHAGIDAVLKEGHAARCDCALSSIGVGLPPGLGATPCGSARCPSRVG